MNGTPGSKNVLTSDVEIKGKAYVVVHDYDVDRDPGDRAHGRNEDGELYAIAGEYCGEI